MTNYFFGKEYNLMTQFKKGSSMSCLSFYNIGARELRFLIS